MIKITTRSPLPLRRRLHCSGCKDITEHFLTSVRDMVRDNKPYHLYECPACHQTQYCSWENLKKGPTPNFGAL